MLNWKIRIYTGIFPYGLGIEEHDFQQYFRQDLRRRRRMGNLKNAPSAAEARTFLSR
jgi:hypothetical protein